MSYSNFLISFSGLVQILCSKLNNFNFKQFCDHAMIDMSAKKVPFHNCLILYFISKCFYLQEWALFTEVPKPTFLRCIKMYRVAFTSV